VKNTNKKTALWVRIVCIVLCVLMAASSIVAAAYMLF